MADGTKLLVVRDPGDVVEDETLLEAKADRESGIVDRAQSTLSFVDGTRTFTIAPVSSSFEYYQAGVLYTQVGADSLVIPDTEGPAYIYYDGDTLNSTPTFTDEIISLYAFVAAVYWDATNAESILLADERHGHVMDWATHAYEHNTFGARFGGGLGLGDMDVDGSGNDASAAQFSVGDGAIWDEDIRHTITHGVPQPLSPVAEIPMFYRTGASGFWRRIAATQFPLATTGSGRAAWNELTGGSWQLTEIGNNRYVLTHYYATGDVRNPVVGLVGQADYDTVSEARAGAQTELQVISFGNLVVLTPEFLPFASVIWQTANSYSNAVQSRVRSTDSGDDYIDWRVARGAAGGASGATPAPVFLDSEFKLVDEGTLFEQTFQLAALTANREIDALDAAGVDAISDAALTAESIPFVDASGRLDEDVSFVRDSATGNIGINQSNPGAKLEVGGQVKITGGSPGVGKVLTDLAGTGLGTWEAAAAGAGGWTDDGIVVRLTTSTDRVGVGTSSPLGLLNVDGVGSVDVPNFLISGATNEVLQLRYDSNGQPFTFSGALNSDIATRVLTNSGGAFVLQGFTGAGADAGVRFQAHGAGTRSAAHVLFETFDTDGATGRQAPGSSDEICAVYAGDSATGTRVLNMLGNGNVGIGADTPGVRLHVKHDANLSTGMKVENDDTGQSAAAAVLADANGTIGYLASYHGSVIGSRWGQTLGGMTELAQSAGAGLAVGTIGSDELILGTVGAMAAYVDTNQNFGIGTIPSEFVHMVKNQNAGTVMKLENTTSGTNARAYVEVGSEAGELLLGAASPAFTAIPYWGDTGFVSASGDLSGGLSLRAVLGGIKLSSTGSTTVHDLVLDTSGQLGLGTEAPGRILELKKATPYLRLHDSTEGNWDQGDIFSGIEFYSSDATHSQLPGVHAYIHALHTREGTGHSGADAGIAVGTMDSTGVATDQLYVTGDGKIGVGGVFPLGTLDVHSPSGVTGAVNNAADELVLRAPSSTGGGSTVMVAAGKSAYHAVAQSGRTLSLYLQGFSAVTSTFEYWDIVADSKIITRFGASTGASGIMGNPSNNDIDWRVETQGLTYGFHVDASADAMGVGGVANASYACAIEGSLRVSSDIDYVGDLNDISDAALKENVGTLSDHLGAVRDKYMALRPVRFTWKETPFLEVGQRAPGGPADFKYGFISQEVAAVFPEVTGMMPFGNLLDPSDPQPGDDDYQEFGGERTGDEKAYLGLKKLEIVAITTAMVQWLVGHAETTREQLGVARNRVETLESQMANVLSRLQALENA